ncbi:response regulator [Roseivirga sp.]|uniref:response regulator n=1 Tax=Roseivirga sp. TaxID=1964215 RepID=UPI002B2703D6|nr:response regulator [Roseivirga sp.]
MENILIVESNTMMRLFLANYLGDNHFVKAVKSPAEALEWLEGNDAALILADYQTKNSQEYQDLSQLKRQADLYTMPMIILTDNDKSEQRIHALELGVSDSISKPFSPIELSLRVNVALKPGQLRTRLQKVA